jgi:hypothetical protein
MNVRSIPLASVLVMAATLTRAPQARAEAPKIFVLPVRSDGWLDQDDRLLEARLALALTAAHRVRPIGARDLPAGTRPLLPQDLAECTTPTCLRLLGQATGAGRVLALELFAEAATPVLIATLYEPRSGEAMDRRELPRAAAHAPSKVWAEEVARWVARSPVTVRPLPTLSPRPALPLVTLAVAPEQTSQAEAQALLAHLRDQLIRRAHPRLALPDAAPSDVTHRALITVEQFAISERPHHVHRYRAGTLAATLTVSDSRTGVVVFTRRASAELTTRAHSSSDQQLMDVLVLEVVSRWLGEIDDVAFDRAVR